MKASARRLSRVEKVLTPKQRVLQWLSKARRSESAEGYFLKILNWPVSEWPGEKLTNAAGTAARMHLKGQPPETVETAARDAVKDILFLLGLVGEMNVLVTGKFRDFEARAALCARGLQLVLILENPACKTGRKSIPYGPSWQDVRRETVAFSTEVSATRRAVDLIAHRFFDGHPIPFSRTDEYLSEAQRSVEALVETYNHALADATSQGSNGKRGAAETQAELPDAIEEAESRETSLVVTASIVREQVAEAKARTAWQIGETELATQVLKGLSERRQ